MSENEKTLTNEDQVMEEQQSLENIEMSELEVLKNLYQRTEQQLRYTRVLCIAMVIFVAAIVVAIVILVPRVVTTLSQVDTALAQVETSLTEISDLTQNANVAITDIQEMSTEISDLSINMNTFLSENAETMGSAMTDISNVDFDALNQAIRDLQSVVSPLANMMNKFR